MRRRKGDPDEELERDLSEPRPPLSTDLGTRLLEMQEASGNAAIATLLERVESGEVPAETLVDPGYEERRAGDIDARRSVLAKRAAAAQTARTELDKPRMRTYAPDDLKVLATLNVQIGALQKRLTDIGVAVGTARSSGAMTPPGLEAQLDALALEMTAIEKRLEEIAARHRRLTTAQREVLLRRMQGLEEPLMAVPRNAMSAGAGAMEVEHLIKKAWLEQHEQTQRIDKEELWLLATGDPSPLCYFDLPERMGPWKIHFALEQNVLRGLTTQSSDQDIRDALLGREAAVMLRAHATAEALGRNDHRNPHYYYLAPKVTPRAEFWDTPQGEEADSHWAEYERQLMKAFENQADALVKQVRDVLEERRKLKPRVTKVGEVLKWDPDLARSG